MSIEITMPALSPTMEKGTLARWLVREGDEVRPGDIIAEIETDKATMEVEAVEEGRIARLLVPEGSEDIPVGQPIAILLEEGEEAADLSDAPASGAAPRPAPVARATADDESATPAPVMTDAVRPSAAMRGEDPEVPPGTQMRQMTVREALRDAMAEEMRRDERVFLMGEEVARYQGAYKVSQGLLEEFGERRVIDTPITEYGFAGLGVGAAFTGLRPIIEFMTFNFAMQAIDHIVNSAAKQRYMTGGQAEVPIVFRGPNGAAARVAAQHSQNYAPWYAAVPGLKVIAPWSAADAKGLLKAAIRDPNPVVFLENEILYGHSFEVPEVDDWVLPIGRARIVREGAHVTIVAYSIAVAAALEAAEALADEGISAEVIDLRTLRPLDIATIVESVRKTNRCVIAEEGWPVCSIASEISARLMEEAFDWLDAPVLRCSDADTPTPYAANLERLWLVKADDVVRAAKVVCYRD